MGRAQWGYLSQLGHRHLGCLEVWGLEASEGSVTLMSGIWLEASVPCRTGLPPCSPQHGGWHRSENPRKERGRGCCTFSYPALEMTRHRFRHSHRSTHIHAPPRNGRCQVTRREEPVGWGIYCAMGWPFLGDTICRSHFLGV